MNEYVFDRCFEANLPIYTSHPTVYHQGKMPNGFKTSILYCGEKKGKKGHFTSLEALPYGATPDP